jgi:hypothetical protein
VFGHSAIRINDPVIQFDYVFNFGTFDFRTPYFYLKFANGELDYMLSAYPYKYFLTEYFNDGRAVTEQKLNLSQSEKQYLYQALITNSQPENKFYRYDFFYDNCATRIRDHLEVALKANLTWPAVAVPQQSFRQLYSAYLEHSPWLNFGINLLLGSKADEIASVRDEMYLPDYLFLHFNKATIIRENGRNVPLVYQTVPILEFDSNLEATPMRLMTPFLIFGLILIAVVIITLLYPCQYRMNVWFDRVFFFATGLIGFLLFYLWFFTQHHVTGNNFNLLWAVPTNAIVAFWIGKPHLKPIVRLYLQGSLGLYVIVLLGWFFLPQSIPSAVVPITLILFVITLKYLYIPRCQDKLKHEKND